MSVSRALEQSASDFCARYFCNFDFAAFESRVEEFTFLRPNNGWIDVYKMMFEKMYKKALEGAALGNADGLDGEAMLDDFEYTLIRPYLRESNAEIKHKPYVGMDRIARLEYLERLTREAPSNPVAFYAERYKKGGLSIGQMRRQARLVLSQENAARERCIEIAGYIQALETVNRGRSFLQRMFRPIRNSAEKRDAALMKQMLVERAEGGESAFDELTAAAYRTFDGHRRTSERLAKSMAQAREELRRMQKMSDAMHESFRSESRDAGFGRTVRVGIYTALAAEKAEMKLS